MRPTATLLRIMPKTDQLGKRIIHPANRSKRVFKLDYRDMTALTGRQRPSKGKEKHGQMITGGLAPKYHLGDPYIVDEAFIQRFRGTKHERSQMYRRQMEWRHQHAIPVEARRVGIRHFLRQVLISQGPLTAERLYAVSQIFPAEPLKSWDEVASSLNIPKMRVPPSPKHLVSSPNKLIEAIEKLRRERYVVRLTLRKWKRLCIAAGTDDGMNFGADARPVGDGERVYVPREIFYPVQKLAAQTKKPNTEEVPMLWRPNLIPSRLVSEEARTCLPSMAPWPGKEAAVQARQSLVEEVREMWARRTAIYGFKRTPKSLLNSVARPETKRIQQQAEDELASISRQYKTFEPYAAKQDPISFPLNST